uniref:Ulp1 protease family, C-terminal catalytic domain-containing protein n=1 Tax=Tanacetum cinerariifolium TaxID=118510 RepID=A0A6L2K229_TANCI|nr:hypothetical protein [Tanacetum cinerariifolium]
MKQKNTKKKNGKSKVNELESIRTRTTPTALFSAMGILNADRKKCLQEMGFGSMIGMPLHEIPGMLGLYVIENLDIEKNELALIDGSIQVTPQSVHDILGAPIGGTLIESLTPRKPDDPFIKEWKSQFGEKSEVRPNDITDVIVSSNDVGSLFKMNFLMLFANTMGMCETSGACSMYILKQISNDIRVENLDWCSYIINCLKSSKYKWVNQASNYYIGPLTFMTLLYLDSTRCDSFNVVRERPAIRAWKSIQMIYREKLEIEKYGGFGMLPKHDLQSEDFVEMIQQKCNNIHQELTTFKEGFSKKDLAGKDDVGKDVVMDDKVEEQNKEDVGKEACSTPENENDEAVDTSLRIKRRGHPMKRGMDNENNECVEIPSSIIRRGRPKKSGRDNENQDAEAVDLLLSIKRCGRPTRHSYHGNVKDVNEPIAEKISDDERDAEETPAFVETKDEQTVHDSCCSKYVDEKYTAKENRNVEQAEAQVEKAELIDECHNNVECSKNVKDKDTDPTIENNDADENTEHTASAFDDIQEEENADDAESVETPSPNKRRGHPMKRGRDNENDEYEKCEFVDIPLPIKRRGRPKKSGRDNEIKDAEAVKSRGGPWK